MYGVAESTYTPVHAIELRWQVPSNWVRRRSELQRMAIWGAALGPGLVTRNPYAGMACLPLLVVLQPTVTASVLLAMSVGTVHAAARAVAVARMARCHAQSPIPLMGAQIGWRQADGLILLCMAATVGYLALH